MPTIEKVWPDGTRGRYTLQPGSPAMLALAAVKPWKLKRRADKRIYPKYVPGLTSTADYVRAYFALNTESITGKPCAYDRYLDHLTLYAPLPDAPAAVYQGLDSVETIPEGEE